jgi:hypothetical protein
MKIKYITVGKNDVNSDLETTNRGNPVGVAGASPRLGTEETSGEVKFVSEDGSG